MSDLVQDSDGDNSPPLFPNIFNNFKRSAASLTSTAPATPSAPAAAAPKTTAILLATPAVQTAQLPAATPQLVKPQPAQIQHIQVQQQQQPVSFAPLFFQLNSEYAFILLVQKKALL